MTSQARSFPPSAPRQTDDDAPDTFAANAKKINRSIHKDVRTPHLSPSETTVLLTLAAMTGDGGIVQWHGPTDIAHRTGLSVASVHNAIKALIKKRVIFPHDTHPAHKAIHAFRVKSFSVDTPPNRAPPVEPSRPEPSHPERLVFHFLADHADDKGAVPWPSYRKIACRTGLSPLAVMRGVNTLISRNVIAPDEMKRGQKTIYVLRLKALSAEGCNA